MNTPEVKDWREMFTVEVADERVTFATEPGECNQNCQLAKEIKCVCRCHGRNHGAALKQHVRSLDDFSDPVAETFNVEEYEQELAILA